MVLSLVIGVLLGVAMAWICIIFGYTISERAYKRTEAVNYSPAVKISKEDYR